MGLIVVSHTLGLIDYKRRYYFVQCAVVIFYLLSMIVFMDSNPLELRTGLFLVLLSFILLLNKFIEKRKSKFV